MARGERKSHWRRLATAFVAAALVLGAAAAFVVSRNERSALMLAGPAGGVRILHDGVSTDGEPGVPRRLAATDVLETLNGTAEVRLVSGAVVELAAQSKIDLAAEERHADAVTEKVRLSLGRVGIRVPKLRPGSTLMVATPDATVTVHGTAFTVEVTKTKAGSFSTDVTVYEGRVAVDSGGRQLLLGPGSHWPSAVTTTPAAASSGAADTLPGSDSAGAPSSSSSSAAARTAKRSTLRAENALFRAAMSARREGQPKKTIALIDQLLRSYPDTPLEGEARALEAEARQKLEVPATP
jgi:hypothetical protein